MLGCSLLSLVFPSCGLGRGREHSSHPGASLCLLPLIPYLPLSSAQVAFRMTLEKEAKGVDLDIAVPKFKQRKRESDGAYIQRMEQEAQHVLFLSKNQADRQPEAPVAPRKKSEGKKACVGLEAWGQGCGVPGWSSAVTVFCSGGHPTPPCDSGKARKEVKNLGLLVTGFLCIGAF